MADGLRDFFETGNPTALAEGLEAASGLPGPRGNLEVVHAFADAAASQTGRNLARLWALSVAWASLPASAAPENTPPVFRVVCGTMAAGAIAAAHPERLTRALRTLSVAAHDSRWRVREGTAMGLQRLLRAHARTALAHLRRWVAGDDWLAMRAVVAAVAEPGILKEPGTAGAAIRLHAAVVDRVLSSGAKERAPFRVLRQALGYSISVVAVARPEEGFGLLRRLAASGDPDGLWIVRENLKKHRLAAFSKEMAAMRGFLTTYGLADG